MAAHRTSRSTVTIHNLPNEVILETLHILFEDTWVDTRAESGYASLRERQFLPATHVCRCWRDIALSTPSFWSWIDMQDTDLAMLCLERYSALLDQRYRTSGGVIKSLSGGGLRVWAEYKAAGEIAKKVVDGVLAVIGSVKDLVISCGLTKEAASLLMQAISKAEILPMLEDVEIIFYPKDDFSRYPIDFRKLPSLRKCSLPSTHFVLSPSCFARTLTELKLDFDSDGIVGMDSILDALDGIDSLETLEIQFPWMHDEDGDNFSGLIPTSPLSSTGALVASTPNTTHVRASPVLLLSLNSLALSTRYGISHVHHFLSNVSLPLSLPGGFEIFTACPLLEHLPPNARMILSPPFIPPEEKQEHELLISAYHYRFVARLTEVSKPHIRNMINVDFAPINPEGATSAEHVRVEGQVLSSGLVFASPNVKTLDIYGDTFNDASGSQAGLMPYAMMYHSCPNIEELTLSGGSILASLSALNVHRTTQTSSGLVQELLGRNLRKVTIEVGLRVPDALGISRACEIILERIRCVMGWRMQMGVRVESVVLGIHDGDVYDELCGERFEGVVGRIRGVVGEFVIEGGGSESGSEGMEVDSEEGEGA